MSFYSAEYELKNIIRHLIRVNENKLVREGKNKK